MKYYYKGTELKDRPDGSFMGQVIAFTGNIAVYGMKLSPETIKDILGNDVTIGVPNEE